MGSNVLIVDGSATVRQRIIRGSHRACLDPAVAWQSEARGPDAMIAAGFDLILPDVGCDKGGLDLVDAVEEQFHPTPPARDVIGHCQG